MCHSLFRSIGADAKQCLCWTPGLFNRSFCHGHRAIGSAVLLAAAPAAFCNTHDLFCWRAATTCQCTAGGRAAQIPSVTVETALAVQLSLRNGRLKQLRVNVPALLASTALDDAELPILAKRGDTDAAPLLGLQDLSVSVSSASTLRWRVFSGISASNGPIAPVLHPTCRRLATALATLHLVCKKHCMSNAERCQEDMISVVRAS